MKKYYTVLFAILLFLLTGLATGCQGSAKVTSAVPNPSSEEISRLRDDYVKMDAKISELEKQVQSLREECMKIQKTQEGAPSQMQSVNPVTIESLQTDIEALHRITCFYAGRPTDYYKYLTDRYGPFQFENKRGNLVVDLPQGRQIILPYSSSN